MAAARKTSSSPGTSRTLVIHNTCRPLRPSVSTKKLVLTPDISPWPSLVRKTAAARVTSCGVHKADN